MGETFPELGGSHYFDIHGATGSRVPKVRPEKAVDIMNALSSATEKGLVAACHDCSEGGIGVAAAEMAFAGGLGMTVHLDAVPLGETCDRDDYILFSESNSRFLVEVTPENKAAFEEAMKVVACAELGQVTAELELMVKGRRGAVVLRADTDKLKEAWQKPLRW